MDILQIIWALMAVLISACVGILVGMMIRQGEGDDHE